jgi:hypothetical protein
MCFHKGYLYKVFIICFYKIQGICRIKLFVQCFLLFQNQGLKLARLNSTGFKDWDKKSIYKVINYEFEKSFTKIMFMM